LKPGEATGVKLMVPKAESPSLLISVEAIEPRTGDLAAPTKEITVALNTAKPTASSQVVPASAPATDAVKRNFNLPPAAPRESAAAQPIPAPLESNNKPSPADSATLMSNGDKLLDVGDFTAARAFFTRARELGNREASLRLGKTYDPVVFRDRNVQGLKPDPTMALKYYLEARTAGIEDADTAINGLETWLKQ
jgi:TPR repeat protein